MIAQPATASPPAIHTIHGWRGLAAGDARDIVIHNRPWHLRHRTEQETARDRAAPLDQLRAPTVWIDNKETDIPAGHSAIGFGPGHRFVLLSRVCPRRGCVVLDGVGDFDAYFCPCGGAHFDSLGRARKGPVRANLSTALIEIEGDTLVLKPAHFALRGKAMRDTLGWD